MDQKDRQELEARNDKRRHELAIQVYERLKQMGDYDDAGGYIKGGLQPRKYSLYKLSLDRITIVDLISSAIHSAISILSLVA